MYRARFRGTWCSERENLSFILHLLMEYHSNRARMHTRIALECTLEYYEILAHSNITKYLHTRILRSTCTLEYYEVLAQSNITKYLHTRILRNTCTLEYYEILAHSNVTKYLHTRILRNTCTLEYYEILNSRFALKHRYRKSMRVVFRSHMSDTTRYFWKPFSTVSRVRSRD